MDLFITRDSAGRKAYARSRARQDVLEALHEALEEAGITRIELAKRLGVRKGAVSQVLNGDGNVRVNTLADYLVELGFQARIKFEPFDFGDSLDSICTEENTLLGLVSGSESAESIPPADTLVKLRLVPHSKAAGLSDDGVSAPQPVYTEDFGHPHYVGLTDLSEESIVPAHNDTGERAHADIR